MEPGKLYRTSMKLNFFKEVDRHDNHFYGVLPKGEILLLISCILDSDFTHRTFKTKFQYKSILIHRIDYELHIKEHYIDIRRRVIW